MDETLAIGSPLPSLTLKNQDNEQVNLDQYLGNPLVVYFYPKDETPGCTAEACSFRDRYEDFEAAGANVVGISSDSVQSHQKFIKKHRLNFTLLSDQRQEAAKAFKVKRRLFGLLPGRETFVFNNEGKLCLKFSSSIMINQHISEALKAIKGF
ncbi:MAG: peroxiredoxin [Cyclobacteriaceae bacterium]